MRVTSPFHKPSMIPLLSTWIKAGPIAFLRKHRKAVNSALLIVSCAPRPVSHTSHASAPFPDHDPALTSRMHLTCRNSQERAVNGNVVPEASNWHASTFVFFFRFAPATRQVAFPQCPSLRGCDVIPLCSPSGIWFLTSFHKRQRYNLCASPCPSSLLQPPHFFSPDQPMSYNLFCTQSSFHDKLPRHVSVLVGLCFVGLSSQRGLDWFQPYSSALPTLDFFFFFRFFVLAQKTENDKKRKQKKQRPTKVFEIVKSFLRPFRSH